MTHRSPFFPLASRVPMVLGALATLAIASPALAHHPFGGQTPSNALEGFASGLGHPIIGFDHFAFVVAAGLLAAVVRGGLAVPLAFLLAALGGTGLHLAEANLPGSEFLVAASVLAVGIVLARRARPGAIATVVLAAVAGIFHGYAYGEAIVGAQMTPLLAYLAGFTVVQLLVAMAAFALARRVGGEAPDTVSLPLRFAGFALCGVGATLLSGLI